MDTDIPLGVDPPVADPALVKALRGPGKYLANQFSLDPQPEQPLLSAETGADILLGSVPGIGQAMALRDIERARRADDKVGMATASAGLVPWGKVAGTLRKPMNELFAGRGALQAPFPDLARAERMTKAGNPETFKKTGWFQGTEETKPWKWEIDDSKMKLKGGIKEASNPPGMVKFQGKVGDIVDHPELFRNYPEIADVNIDAALHPSFARSGGYDHKGNVITNTASNMDELKSTVLHEIQHAIQARETGFATGSNPDRLNAALKATRGMFQTVAPNSSVDKNFGLNKYMREMGETEARTTQLRKDMTAAERRKVHPYTQELPTSVRMSQEDIAQAIVDTASHGSPVMDQLKDLIPQLVKTLRNRI